MAVGVIGVAPAAFWTMTPAALVAVFREHNRSQSERFDALQKMGDQRAALMASLHAKLAGDKGGFDGRSMFPSLWDDEYLGIEVDDARVIAQVHAFVDGHRAWRRASKPVEA